MKRWKVVNRELDLMKGFPVCQAVPRVEVASQSLVHTLVLQETGTKTGQIAFCGETVRKFSGHKLLQSDSSG